MVKETSLGFLLVILSACFVYGSAGFAVAQPTKGFSGVLQSDVTWTAANGPYSLTGNLLVSSGVTLKNRARCHR